MIRFQSWAGTHPGAVRTHNEDSFVDRPDLGLWAVADGAGGHDAGEVASGRLKEALETVLENLIENAMGFSPPGRPVRVALRREGAEAVLRAARAHGVPFHVCAPWSTVDAATPHGDAIDIEQRHRDELALAGDRRVLPDGVPVYNPAFDVTPRALVTHYITDRGVVTPPFSS
jgi:hypothetical protein